MAKTAKTATTANNIYYLSKPVRLWRRSKQFCYLGRQGSANRWAAFFLDAISAQSLQQPRELTSLKQLSALDVCSFDGLAQEKPMPRPTLCLFGDNDKSLSGLY